MQHKREELKKTRKTLEDIGDKSSLIAELESRIEAIEREHKEMELKKAELKGEEERYLSVKKEKVVGDLGH